MRTTARYTLWGSLVVALVLVCSAAALAQGEIPQHAAGFPWSMVGVAVNGLLTLGMGALGFSIRARNRDEDLRRAEEDKRHKAQQEAEAKRRAEEEARQQALLGDVQRIDNNVFTLGENLQRLASWTAAGLASTGVEVYDVRRVCVTQHGVQPGQDPVVKQLEFAELHLEPLERRGTR